MDATVDRQDVNTLEEIRQLDLEVTAVRRRSDGVYLVISNGAIVLSLSWRQMKFVLGIANAAPESTVRSQLYEVAYPDRPRMPLKHPEKRAGKEVTSRPVPLSPTERAVMARTLRRLDNLWLIERRRDEVVPTASAVAITNWLNQHPEVLAEDELDTWTRKPKD